MTDDSLLADWPPLPPAGRKRRELLFEFVRPLDRCPIACELRFHGESYGWEVQFLDRDGLWLGHGAFVTRAAAGAVGGGTPPLDRGGNAGRTVIVGNVSQHVAAISDVRRRAQGRANESTIQCSGL